MLAILLTTVESNDNKKMEESLKNIYNQEEK